MSTEQLKAEIEQKRSELARVWAELRALRREMDDFAVLYNRTIGPLEAQLDTIRQQIEALQFQDLPSINLDLRSVWGSEYESVEAQYRRAMDPNASPKPKKISAKASPSATETLKTLYRQLARQFHPDTTTDPAEKARLTVIMAQINAAYRAKNIEELYKIANRKPEPQSAPIYKPPSTFSELLELSKKLDEEIAWVKSEKLRLLASPLMALKIEYSLARSRGRDLLQEIAVKVRADLEAALAELKSLKR